MGVVAAGVLTCALPGLDGDMAVGFRRQLQDHLAGVDVALDFRHALVTPSPSPAPLSSPSCWTSSSVFQAMPLPPLPTLFHQRAERGEAFVDVGVVALDHRHLRRAVLPGIRSHSPFFQSLTSKGWPVRPGVVHRRCQHQLLLDAEVADTDLAELLAKPL